VERSYFVVLAAIWSANRAPPSVMSLPHACTSMTTSPPVALTLRIGASADESGQPSRQMRYQATVGVHSLFYVGEVAALDNAVEPLGAADQHA
jgi:hypothetical protein